MLEQISQLSSEEKEEVKLLNEMSLLLNNDNVKISKIDFKVNKETKKMINDYCKLIGITKSVFIRRCIMRYINDELKTLFKLGTY